MPVILALRRRRQGFYEVKSQSQLWITFEDPVSKQSNNNNKIKQYDFHQGVMIEGETGVGAWKHRSESSLQETALKCLHEGRVYHLKGLSSCLWHQWGRKLYLSCSSWYSSQHRPRAPLAILKNKVRGFSPRDLSRKLPPISQGLFLTIF